MILGIVAALAGGSLLAGSRFIPLGSPDFSKYPSDQGTVVLRASLLTDTSSTAPEFVGLDTQNLYYFTAADFPHLEIHIDDTISILYSTTDILDTTTLNGPVLTGVDANYQNITFPTTAKYQCRKVFFQNIVSGKYTAALNQVCTTSDASNLRESVSSGPPKYRVHFQITEGQHGAPVLGGEWIMLDAQRLETLLPPGQRFTPCHT